MGVGAGQKFFLVPLTVEELLARHAAWKDAPTEAERLPEGTWLARKAGLVGFVATKVMAVVDVRRNLEIQHTPEGEDPPPSFL